MKWIYVIYVLIVLFLDRTVRDKFYESARSYNHTNKGDKHNGFYFDKMLSMAICKLYLKSKVINKIETNMYYCGIPGGDLV